METFEGVCLFFAYLLCNFVTVKRWAKTKTPEPSEKTNAKFAYNFFFL